jgi:hypothetical protein
MRGNDDLVYASQKLDDINKLGIKRSGYRADHESIKKKIHSFKSEFFKVLNLEQDVRQQLEIAQQLEVQETIDSMTRCLEILKSGRVADEIFQTIDEVLDI